MFSHEDSCQEGDVRLLNGTTRAQGQIQFCYNDHWISIHGHPYDLWGTNEANVVCRQLGFATFGAKTYWDDRYGVGTTQNWLTYVVCNGNESKLQFCHYQINYGYLDYNYYSTAISCIGEE